jgi:uncharacterized membrane protein YbhN (UPF0104 family)
MTSTASTWVRRAVGVSLVVALLAVALPRLSGTAWHDVVAALGQVRVRQLLILTGLWIGGLAVHTITLTAALPRLTHRRALTLSLTGSAVANVLPVGGAAGVAVNYKMVRGWGFDRTAFATYTVVTNLWDVLMKLCLPALALGWLVESGSVVAGHLVGTTLAATGALVVLSGLAVLTLTRASVARAVGAGLDVSLAWALALVGSRREVRVGRAIVDLQAACAALIRSAWPRLTLGMVGYTASLAVLLTMCLHVTGAGLALPAVFAGFAVERVLTLAGLTPGGAGVVEVGLTGLLLALGGDPLGVVTGVVLYRAFTYGLEIPVGGVGLLTWWWASRHPAAVGGAS